MSAFQVTDLHIAALVFAAHVSPFASCMDLADQTATGRMLIRENMASLAKRYGDKIDEEAIAAWTYDPVATPAELARKNVRDPLSLIKLVHCYQYQSCEHDGWETSNAASYCRQLLTLLTQALPGYDKAPWGL